MIKVGGNGGDGGDDGGVGDLLVDDVEGEDADAVELLLPGSCAHRMKGAAE